MRNSLKFYFVFLAMVFSIFMVLIIVREVKSGNEPELDQLVVITNSIAAYAAEPTEVSSPTASGVQASVATAEEDPYIKLAFEFSQNIMLQSLLKPETAQFAPYWDSTVTILGDNKYEIISYATAETQTGEMSTVNYKVTVEVLNGGTQFQHYGIVLWD